MTCKENWLCNSDYSQVLLGFPSSVFGSFVAEPLDFVEYGFAIVKGVPQDLFDNIFIGVVFVIIIIVVVVFLDVV